ETEGPARILIIDDDEFALARMSETLSPRGTVRHASNCAEAWSMIASDIDLVIASLSIQGSDALRFVSQCRANEASRQLPILLISEDRDLPRLAKGLDLGANDYVTRPVDRNELQARTMTQILRKRLQDRLQESYQRCIELALTDPLTGLYDRAYLDRHLDELIKRVNQDGISAAVLMFDIDHFKRVNDTHGHDAGDDVLRELAVRALNSVRTVDLVARQGGEEFVVVMPETDLAIAAAVAERLRAAVAREPFAIKADGQNIPITISVGVTSAAAGGDNREKMLKRADIALYMAKNQGRNRVVVRSPDGPPRAVA
ncbi:MAG: diguanylate cyclase, partial [Alphaproteobacteria bacterium]|nr:diguanylate cyclase [Alphaproteobacteria bacterium]